MFSWVFHDLSADAGRQHSNLWTPRRHVRPQESVLLGAGLFLLGAVLCGFAWGMIPLICFRAIEGLGAGAIQPIAATILGDIYTPSERAHVQGIVSSVFGISAVVGPSLGRIPDPNTYPGRWCFWIHVPIGLIAITMVGLFLHETAEPRLRSIDWIGALLTFATAGGLILVLVQGESSQPRPLRIGVGDQCAGWRCCCLVHESRTKEPMLPIELWRHNRVVVIGSLGSCAAGGDDDGGSSAYPGTAGIRARRNGIQRHDWRPRAWRDWSVSWALASLLGARIMVRTTYRLVAGYWARSRWSSVARF